MAIDIERLKEAMRSFNEKHDLCPECVGVGCLPEHFGIGNPDSKPCPNCDGFGYTPKELEMF